MFDGCPGKKKTLVMDTLALKGKFGLAWFALCCYLRYRRFFVKKVFGGVEIKKYSYLVLEREKISI